MTSGCAGMPRKTRYASVLNAAVHWFPSSRPRAERPGLWGDINAGVCRAVRVIVLFTLLSAKLARLYIVVGF